MVEETLLWAVPVVVEGETGTGKELLARLMHEWSGRPGQFIAINCAALSDTLIESQLFGHVKGSFTDAAADYPGAARLAAVGADGYGVVPGDAGAGERQGHRRDGRQDAEVRGPEPFSQKARYAEEPGIPGGEHGYRTAFRFYA